MPRKEHAPALPDAGADADSVDSLLREAVDILDPSSGGLPRIGLLPGDILADRFVIERLAGSGGMGTIHRGKDLESHEAVAIKVLASAGQGHANRFAREVAVLAELSHPAIVRYIAHGTTPQDAPFLAMEWLEGEDLAVRLARLPLTVDESLVVVRRACEGVAAANARGVVHRDLKPSNLFLVDCEPARLKVLDFGIARQSEGTRALTQSGTVLGTVGYMSPEQAMGSRGVDARTDVFALGCVLFECLTGRAAFVGPNAVAVLAKVLREDPPRVSQLRSGLCEALDTLVARLLAKSPDGRPKDAVALLRALDEIGQAASSAPPSRPPVGLSAAEQKIVSVILGRPRRGCALPAEPMNGDMSRIQELARRFGAEPVAMRGGGLLVVLSGGGAATDQASQAARCALLLGRMRPELCVAVATGRAETTERIPVGAAIDRAAELLAQSDDPREGIDIDELTAGLLEPGFEVRRYGNQLVLGRERADLEAIRLLMGKPTPFVGRDRELGLLELTLRECIDESVARAVLVTGPPGQGKSRLRYEFVAKVREGSHVRILMARADPVGAGSAFALLRQLVRHATGVHEGDPETVQRARLRAHVANACHGADAPRIAEFLGELIGMPSSEPPSPQLRAARNDRQIMGVWLRRSFGEWLAAECVANPLLLVLEDLHWGDLPSVTYLGEALRSVKSPLLVLALARPEVHEAFPSLWVGAEKIELPLGRLTPRAAERIVREALGENLAADGVARIIERAGGNAFYLEELIRRVTRGDAESLPETVLALTQSRLERLEPEARRIVRAASIFGEAFWPGGLAAVLGADASTSDLDAWLRTLLELELFTAVRDSHFPRESEYRFRHGLLREAAHAMLTGADRATGHGLAGDWLERAGERDALILADHFERAGLSLRAVPWLLNAARTAFDGGNLDAAFALAQRGVDCRPANDGLGLLRGVQAGVLAARGDWAHSVDFLRQSLPLLKVGSQEWVAGAARLFLAGISLRDSSVSGPMLMVLMDPSVRPEPSGPYGRAVYYVCVGLISMSQFEVARSFLERAESACKGPLTESVDIDPVFLSSLRVARGHLHCFRAELGAAMRALAEARVLADRAGDTIGRAVAGVCSIQVLVEVGDLKRTETSARDLRTLCASIGPGPFLDWSEYFLAWGRLNAGRAAESVASFRALLDRPDAFLAPVARASLAHALAATGNLDAAEREATTAQAETAMLPATRALSLAALARVELYRGQPARALALVERSQAAGTSGEPSHESIVCLTRAEALQALDRNDEARAAIHEARDRIRRIAATLDDAELRQSYMTNIAANARTLELAREWLNEDAP